MRGVPVVKPSREAFLALYTAYIERVDLEARKRGHHAGVLAGNGLRRDHVPQFTEEFVRDQVELAPEPGEPLDADLRPYLYAAGIKCPWSLIRPEVDLEA